MKKILITGSTGFIGSNILKNISYTNNVYIILRKKIKIHRHKKIKIINYKNFNDLNSKLKKIKIDIIIHCATHYVKKQVCLPVWFPIDLNIGSSATATVSEDDINKGESEKEARESSENSVDYD